MSSRLTYALVRCGIEHWYVSTLSISAQQLTNITRSTGDTKAGTLIGVDRYGNKYFENLEELPRKKTLQLMLSHSNMKF